MIVGCLFSWFVISLVREVPQFAVSAYLVHVLPGRTRISPIPAALSPLSRFTPPSWAEVSGTSARLPATRPSAPTPSYPRRTSSSCPTPSSIRASGSIPWSPGGPTSASTAEPRSSAPRATSSARCASSTPSPAPTACPSTKSRTCGSWPTWPSMPWRAGGISWRRIRTVEGRTATPSRAPLTIC